MSKYMRLSILFLIIAVLSIIICIGSLMISNAKGGDLDDHLRSSLFGVWKELHHQDCLDGESIVVYYPHMRFEEFTTYIANEDCEFLNEDGYILRAGEDVHKVVSGTWDVVEGYIHFTTDLGKKVTTLKVVFMGTKEARFRWDNGNTLHGFKIGGIIR